MKRSFLLLAIACATFSLQSCRDREDNDDKKFILRDSVRNILPTWQSLDITVSEDRTEIKVVVGDPDFYNTVTTEKYQKANDLGKMIVRLYGKDSYLDKASLIVTKDIHNTSEAPKDGIVTPINIEELKKGGK